MSGCGESKITNGGNNSISINMRATSLGRSYPNSVLCNGRAGALYIVSCGTLAASHHNTLHKVSLFIAIESYGIHGAIDVKKLSQSESERDLWLENSTRSY